MILAIDCLGSRAQVPVAGFPLTVTVPNRLDVWLEAIVCSPLGLVQAPEPGHPISNAATIDLLRRSEAVVNWMRNSTP
jgi:hypothetical protein